MNKKKSVLKSLFLVLCFVLGNKEKLLCENENLNIGMSQESISFDDLDLSDLNFDDLILPDSSQRIPTRAIDDDLLASLIPVVLSIREPLWRNTKPPKGRDILYLLPHRISVLEYGGFLINPFLNYTKRMPFSPDEALKLDENQEALDNFTKVLTEELSVNEASALIPLFKKLTIQEARAGAIIQGGFVSGPLNFQLHTSVFVSERNFWLSKQDRDRVKEIFAGLDSDFNESELYKIRYGMGDTRLRLGLNTLNMSQFQLDLGYELIVPSSIISNIPRLKRYYIDTTNFEDQIPNVLRNIRDNLINPRLGNGGHLGFGCYAESKVGLLNNRLQLWNRISFDNLFEAKEDRLIPSFPKMDPNDLIMNPDLITEFLKQYILPPAYKVSVKPGGILNFVANLTFDLNKSWGFGIGYDYYMQQAEKFELIDDDACLDELRVDDASEPRVSQHKIFVQANYTKEQRSCDLIFGFGADYTFCREKLGNDWTIFLRFGVAF